MELILVLERQGRNHLTHPVPFPIARQVAGFVRHQILSTSSTNIRSEAVGENVIAVMNLSVLFAIYGYPFLKQPKASVYRLSSITADCAERSQRRRCWIGHVHTVVHSDTSGRLRDEMLSSRADIAPNCNRARWRQCTGF